MGKNAQLRRVMDGNDPFISGGHQIVKARSYKRVVRKWVSNDEKVREIIRRAFPKLETNERQREGARRWAAVINFYFRLGYTESQTAEEIGSTKEKINMVIRAITRVSKGLRADGRGPLMGNRGKWQRKK